MKLQFRFSPQVAHIVQLVNSDAGSSGARCFLCFCFFVFLFVFLGRGVLSISHFCVVEKPFSGVRCISHFCLVGKPFSNPVLSSSGLSAAVRTAATGHSIMRWVVQHFFLSDPGKPGVR